MRVAALILGIIGGLFGLGGSGFALLVGGVDAAVNGSSGIVGLGFVAVLISIYGIVAGALAMKFPRFAGWSMIATAVIGFIAVSLGYIIAGPLLLVGGILSLVGAKQAKTEKLSA